MAVLSSPPTSACGERVKQPVFLLLALLFPVALPAVTPGAHWLAQSEQFGDDLDPTQRLRITQELQQALSSAEVQAALPPRKAAQAVSLQWPLRSMRSGYFGYHGVSNFVDHDLTFPNHVRDYVCGARSYDTAAGYNHAGTDYFIWPFPWRMMDEGDVAVVAAAPGVLLGSHDGEQDRSCAMGDASWNAVYIRHDDGSIAWYGHLKRGSVSERQAGERVEAGEYLGLVGSSGSSTGPHLHFELHDAADRVIDPKNGACNATPELWQVPQPYEDPAINTLSLHSAEPQWVNCGVVNGFAVNETTYAIDVVAPGQTFVTVASFRDHRNGDVSRFSLLQPDGSVFAEWQHDLAGENLPRPFYTGTAWSWSHTLPTTARPGEWRFVAEFHGHRYELPFQVGDPAQLRAEAVRRERAAIAALRRDAE